MDPETSRLVGMILIGVGIMDPVIGVFLIAPKTKDPRARTIVTGSLVASGLVMIGIGAAMLMGLFS